MAEIFKMNDYAQSADGSSMKLTEQDRLNHGEQDKIMDLLKRCHEKEAFSMTFPLLEPGTKYLLAYDSKDPKELRAVMALCGLGNQIFEVYAFTDPDYRKQGYFRRLWEKAKITFPGKSLKGAAPVVRFPIDGSCKDALPVLLSIGAHLAEEETESGARSRSSCSWGPGLACASAAANAS